MSDEIKLTKKELRKQKKEARKAQKKERQLLTVTEYCKGCGASMALDQRFCNACGAKRMYNRLNFRNLTEDFVDRFLNVENNFFRTFIDLFKNPKDVIDGYINGVRKKHLSAFSYFAISLTLIGLYTFVFKEWLLEEMIASGAGIDVDVEGQKFEEGAKAVNRQIGEWFFDNQSILNILNIPLYAIVSRLVFWNYKKYNFIEHIVIYLYTYSHIQIISSVIGIIFFWSSAAQMVLSGLILVTLFFYTAYVLYVLFELTIEKLLLKTLLFSIIFGIVAITFFGVIAFLAYKLGFLDEFIEQMKQISFEQKQLLNAQKLKDSLRVDSIQKAGLLVKDSLSGLGIDSLKNTSN